MILLEPIISFDPGQQYREMLSRHAVKALCEYGDQIIVLSLNDGTCKLPGGGVATGEDETEALSRELQEECGIVDLSIDHLAYRLDEYRPDKYSYSTLFCMTTNIYICRVDSISREQNLDGYELALGMKPILVEKSALIDLFQPTVHDWSARDRRVVEAYVGARYS